MLLLEDREVRQVRSHMLQSVIFRSINYSDTVDNVLYYITVITLQGGQNPRCHSVLRYWFEDRVLSSVTN